MCLKVKAFLLLFLLDTLRFLFHKEAELTLSTSSLFDLDGFNKKGEVFSFHLCMLSLRGCLPKLHKGEGGSM